MKNIIMKCGHSASAEQLDINGNFIPYCTICYPKLVSYESNESATTETTNESFEEK